MTHNGSHDVWKRLIKLYCGVEVKDTIDQRAICWYVWLSRLYQSFRDSNFLKHYVPILACRPFNEKSRTRALVSIVGQFIGPFNEWSQNCLSAEAGILTNKCQKIMRIQSQLIGYNDLRLFYVYIVCKVVALIARYHLNGRQLAGVFHDLAGWLFVAPDKATEEWNLDDVYAIFNEEEVLAPVSMTEQSNHVVVAMNNWMTGRCQTGASVVRTDGPHAKGKCSSIVGQLIKVPVQDDEKSATTEWFGSSPKEREQWEAKALRAAGCLSTAGAYGRMSKSVERSMYNETARARWLFRRSNGSVTWRCAIPHCCLKTDCNGRNIQLVAITAGIFMGFKIRDKEWLKLKKDPAAHGTSAMKKWMNADTLDQYTPQTMDEFPDIPEILMCITECESCTDSVSVSLSAPAQDSGRIRPVTLGDLFSTVISIDESVEAAIPPPPRDPRMVKKKGVCSLVIMC